MNALSWARVEKLVGCVACALVLAATLAGCHSDAYYDAQAPTPTINPHAHKYSRLKITVEPGSGVNRVEVYSIWAIGNLDCAPRRWPSGSTIQKQVAVKEPVQQIDGYYLATISDDYFLPGRCNWNTSAAWANVKFLHDDKFLAQGGGSPALFAASHTLKLVCMPPPQVPLCELSKLKETFDRTHFTGVFDATLEIKP